MYTCGFCPQRVIFRGRNAQDVYKRQSGGFSIFDDPDFRGRFCGWGAIGARRILRIVV